MRDEVDIVDGLFGEIFYWYFVEHFLVVMDYTSHAQIKLCTCIRACDVFCSPSTFALCYSFFGLNECPSGRMVPAAGKQVVMEYS